MIRNIRILGTGKYLPQTIVTAEDLDKRLGLKDGWVLRKSGVRIRHQIGKDETASDMAVKAIHQALENAGLTLNDIDCIVSTAGTYEQPIPCNASLIKEKLGFVDNPLPAFDINSTCLGFVVGLDVISYLVEAERYKNVVLVSSEVSSVGINYRQKESCVLFGDGASAVVIAKTTGTETSKLLASRVETFEQGAHHTEIRGGGTKLHPRNHSKTTEEEFLFDMDGRAVFKLSLKVIDGYMKRLFDENNLTMDDIALVIPHQASGMAMELMRKRLGIEEERFMNIIVNHGNIISASIPMALHEAIVQEKIKRGDNVMLLGTSAGLSIGGVVFEY